MIHLSFDHHSTGTGGKKKGDDWELRAERRGGNFGTYEGKGARKQKKGPEVGGEMKGTEKLERRQTPSNWVATTTGLGWAGLPRQRPETLHKVLSEHQITRSHGGPDADHADGITCHFVIIM